MPKSGSSAGAPTSAAVGSSTIDVAKTDGGEDTSALEADPSLPETAPAADPAAPVVAPADTPTAEAPSEEPEPSDTAPDLDASAASDLSDQYAALLDWVSTRAARAGATGDVKLSVLSTDPTGQGAIILFNAEKLSDARTAAGAALHSDDGREWRYLGNGPDLDTGRFNVLMHVASPAHFATTGTGSVAETELPTDSAAGAAETPGSTDGAAGNT